MVAIVTGASNGFDRTSLTPLGAQGLLGDPTFGDQGVNVTVNAGNGNLIVQRTDQVLTGTGLDDITTDTYNSMGALAYAFVGTENAYGAARGWQTNDGRMVWGLSGTLGASGSKIMRTDADGSAETYNWVSGDTYVCEQTGNADDQLTFSSSTNTWTWTDGDSGVTESYDWSNGGRITSSTDANGNALTYSYNSSNLLSQVTKADGEYTLFTYNSSNLLIQLTDYVHTTTSTSALTAEPSITYTYDSSNRLSTVTTPTWTGNPSVVTTYGYSGTTTLVSSISQTGGAQLTIAYDSSWRVSSVTQAVASGVTYTTSFTYNSGNTAIQDANGNTTTLYYDSSKNLTQINSPTGQNTYFTYDANGNVTQAKDALGNATNFTYDSNDNLLTKTDPLGNTTTYTYDAKNHVLTETTAPGSGLPGVTSTTYNVYDANENLRFTIDGDGDVTQYVYGLGYGLLQSVIHYPTDPYTATLSPSSPPSLTTMTTWASGLTDLTNSQRTDYAYDWRGNVTEQITYSACDATGIGAGGGALFTLFLYTYDPSGRLISKQTNTVGNSETFTYDGLGRLLTSSTTDGTTYYGYNDTMNTAFTVSPLGVGTARFYNLAGQLFSTQQSLDTFITFFNSVNTAYDSLGNLCMITDTFGNKSYFLYDTDGRKVADIAADGSITRTIYTADNQVAATVTYANKLSSAQLASLVNTSGQPTDPALSSVLPTASSGDSWSWNIYDSDNRRIEAIDGDGDATVFTYDNNSNLIQTKSYANALSSSLVSGFITTPPTTLQLPTASSGKDDVTRNFFDNAGQLYATLDGNGYLTRYYYDAAGEVTRTLAFANAAASTYWATGTESQLQTSITTSSRDVSTYYVYDGRGVLRYTLDSNLQVTEYQNTWNGELSYTTQYAGSISALSSYTAASVQSAVSTAGLASLAANRTTRNIYDTTTGNLDYTIDPDGDVTQYSYNAAGQVTKQIQFATLYTTAGVPTASAMASWVSSNASTADRTTRTVYNASGQVVYTAQVCDTSGNSYVTGYTRDAEGRVVNKDQYAASYAVTDSATQTSLATLIGSPSGTVDEHYVYNADGQLSDSYDGMGIRTRFVYDTLGRVVYSTVAYGLADASVTGYAYDAAGNLLAETQGLFSSAYATTSYTYDGFGNVLTATDPNGNVTHYTYDSLGNVLSSTDATGAVTSNTYDAFNNVQTSTNALGGITNFFYDDLDRLVLQIDPMGYATKTIYGFGSEIASVTHYVTAYTGTITPGVQPTITTNAQDATTSFTRDQLGQVTHETDAVGNVQTFYYDAFGDQTQFVNALGSGTVYTYDNRGLVLTKTVGGEVDTNPDGSVETYGGIVTKYSYDARGNRTQMVEAYGLTEQRTTNYTYDALNRLASVSGDAVSAYSASLTPTTVTPTTTYTYDDRGDLIETQDPDGAQTFTYYDAVGRKIAQIDTVTIGSTGTLSTWTYDANGNATACTVYGTLIALPTTAGGAPPTPPSGDSRLTSYTYDADNRLLTTTVASVYGGVYGVFPTYWALTYNNTVTNTYDAMGNLTEQTGANHIYSYYDKAGRKIAQVDQDNYLTTYTLDANGNVLTETQYATQLSGTPSVGTVPTAPSSTSNDRITTFTYDKNGNRLTETRASVAAYSVNGTTGALTSATGNSTMTYTYNGLGEVLSKTQATGDYTDYNYDGQGRLIQILQQPISGTQNTTWEYYDGLNNLTHISEYDLLNPSSPAPRTTSYTYGAGGRLASTTDADGATRYYYYDADGRTMEVLYTQTLSSGGYVFVRDNYAYDGQGRVIVQGTQGFDWGTSSWVINDQYETAYNAYGDVISQSINGVVQTTNTYDTMGNLVSTTTDGVTTLYMYDANGNRTLTISSNGAALPSGYSWSTLTPTQAISLLTAGGTTTVAANDTDTVGLVVTFTTYNGRGQVLSTYQPWRQLSASLTTTIVQSNTYDAFGDVISSTDANGNTTNYSYSTLGNLTQQVLPSVSYTLANGTVGSAHPTTYYYYDISGRQIGTMDARGNITTQSLLADTGYDGSTASVLKTFDPDGGISSNTYDVFGDLVAQTDLTGLNTTYYKYDGMGRLIEQDDPVRAAYSAGNPSGSPVQLINYYAYDELGQRIKSWNNQLGSGFAATTDYDTEGRIVKEVDMAGHVTTNSYVWNGSAVTGGLGTFGGWTDTTVNSSGVTQTQTQNAAGKTIAETDFGGNTYSFSYDLAGRLTSQANTTVSGTGTTYSYYNTGLLESANFVSSYGGFDTFGGAFSAPGGIPAAGSETIAQAYTYDAQGNRLSEATTETASITVDYYAGLTLTSWSGDEEIDSESATATYDALNRITSLNEAAGDVTYSTTFGSGSFAYSPSADIAWQYDLNGNVRNQQSTYQTVSSSGAISSGTTTQTEWFAYDSMNRVTTSNGEFVGSAGSGYIDRGVNGTDYSYNAAGERVSSAVTLETQSGSTYYWQEQRTLYTYTADGYLAQANLALGSTSSSLSSTYVQPAAATGSGYTLASYTLDQMGRVTSQSETNTTGSAAGTLTVYSRTGITYDNDSNITYDQVTDLETNNNWSSYDTYYTTDTYGYNDIGTSVYDGGNLTTIASSTSKNGGTAVNSTTQNYYTWTTGTLLESSIIYTPDTTKSTTWDTGYAYDASGHLEAAQISDGSPRYVGYITNLAGEIMSANTYGAADSSDMFGSAIGNAPDSFYYFFNNVQEGVVTNNGSQNESYKASIAQQTVKPGTGLFTGGATTGTPYAAFGTQLEQINGLGNQTQTASGYTVQSGDTLQSIAQELWGDSSYWYVLADANGLDGSAALQSGQNLVIPQVVGPSQNNASTNTVYNASQAMGNTSPTHPPKPQPHNNGCGGLGEILLAVVAIAVSVFTYGALSGLTATFWGSVEAGAISGVAGSVVSQGVGLATGIQSKFSWAGVAEGAIGGAIGGGLGFGSATGTQAFSSLGPVGGAIARGVVGSIAGQGLDVALGLQSKFDWVGVAAAGVGAGVAAEISDSIDGSAGGTPGTDSYYGPTPMNLFISGVAGDIANAVTRTAINGSNFLDNLGRALPDTIGQTIGNAVAGAETSANQSSPPLSQAELDDIVNTVNNLPDGGTNGAQVSETEAGNIVLASDAVYDNGVPVGTLGATANIPLEVDENGIGKVFSGSDGNEYANGFDGELYQWDDSSSRWLDTGPLDGNVPSPIADGGGSADLSDNPNLIPSAFNAADFLSNIAPSITTNGRSPSTLNAYAPETIFNKATLVRAGNELEHVADQAGAISGPLELGGLVVAGVATFALLPLAPELAVAGAVGEVVDLSLAAASVGGTAGLIAGTAQTAGGLLQGAGGAGYSNFWNGGAALAGGLVLHGLGKSAIGTPVTVSERRLAKAIGNLNTVAGGAYDVLTSVFGGPTQKPVPPEQR